MRPNAQDKVKSNLRSENQARRVWTEMVGAVHTVEKHRFALLTTHRRVLPKIIKQALLSPRERRSALEVLSHMTAEEVKEVFPDLLSVAIHVCPEITKARELVLSLPRPWLVENLKTVATHLLATGDDEDYRRMLEVFLEVDLGLAMELARTAANQENVQIKIVGREFLRDIAKL